MAEDIKPAAQLFHQLAYRRRESGPAVHKPSGGARRIIAREASAPRPENLELCIWHYIFKLFFSIPTNLYADDFSSPLGGRTLDKFKQLQRWLSSLTAQFDSTIAIRISVWQSSCSTRSPVTLQATQRVRYWKRIFSRCRLQATATTLGGLQRQ